MCFGAEGRGAHARRVPRAGGVTARIAIDGDGARWRDACASGAQGEPPDRGR
jgi:hypothetical protein